MKVAKARHIQAGILCLVAASCGGPDFGVSKEEIKIGTWAPLSGPAAPVSVIAKAMEAYFASINAEGGVHGRRLRLIIKDDRYDPKRTVEAVKELVEQDHVFAMLGGIGTANCMAVKEYLFLKSIPWINPGSASRAMTIPVQGNIYSLMPTNVTEGRVLAKYAAEELKASKIALFQQDDSFGHEGQEGVRLGLRDLNVKLAATAAYQLAEEDLSHYARMLKESGATAVIMFALPQQAARLVQEFGKIDYRPQLLATQALSDPDMFKTAGPGWEGAVVATGTLNPNSDRSEVVRAREIVAKYAPSITFGSLALAGMGWAETMVQALEKIGPEPNRVKFIYTMERFESTENFFGRPIRFTENSHHGLAALRLMRAEGGHFVDLTDWIEP